MKYVPDHELLPPTCDDRTLWDLFASVNYFPALAVADELGIFPRIEKAGSMSLEQISDETDLSIRSSEILIGSLTSLGLLTLRESRYYNSEVTRNFLLPDGDFYWGGLIKFAREAPRNYSSLFESIRGDKPVIYGPGTDMWETHEMSPELSRAFTAAMHSQSLPAALGMAANGDFDGVQSLLDVAGGSGCFCITLAQRHPEMKFTLLELPSVCQAASLYIKKYEFQNRIKTVEANMFKDPWPISNDAILFSNVLHDWDWDSCAYLVKKGYELLPRGGKIFVHEMLLSDTKEGPLTTNGLSLTMIFATRGRQYSMAEVRELLNGGGFVDVKMANTYGYFSLVTATKP